MGWKDDLANDAREPTVENVAVENTAETTSLYGLDDLLHGKPRLSLLTATVLTLYRECLDAAVSCVVIPIAKILFIVSWLE